MLIANVSRRSQSRFAVLLPTLVLILVSIASVSVHAQESGGNLGAVTDPSGAAVGNAKVTIRNTATGVVRNVTTNSEGLYIAPNLIPGRYEVRVEATGFSTAVQSGLY